MKKIIRVFVAPICTASTAAQTESASASVKRVESIVSKMSLEEKIDYIGGTGFAIRAMPNLHLPAFEMSDGAPGCAQQFPVSLYSLCRGHWTRSNLEP
jgi:beta-glucosidase